MFATLIVRVTFISQFFFPEIREIYVSRKYHVISFCLFRDASLSEILILLTYCVRPVFFSRPIAPEFNPYIEGAGKEESVTGLLLCK